MSNNAAVRLDGYFDWNFGDDYMFKIVAHYLPDVDFHVNVREEQVPALSGMHNVYFMSDMERKLPLLTVIGSGFMITGFRMLRYELSFFLRGRRAGDYCIGCNIEPFKTPLRAFLMQERLNKYRLITCRDRKSERWLRKHCKQPEIHYAPDILFSMPDAWLSPKTEEGLLGIAALHRAKDGEDAQQYRTLAEMADLWVEETGKEVLLLAFDTGKEDDVFACEAIKKKMAHPENAHIIMHRDGTEILQAVSRCEKIICARFHAAVLALRMGIAFYPLHYRRKIRNMIQDLGCAQTGSDLDHMDKNGLRAFLTQPQQVHELSQEILEGAKQHMRLLRAKIEKEGKL